MYCFTQLSTPWQLLVTTAVTQGSRARSTSQFHCTFLPSFLTWPSGTSQSTVAAPLQPYGHFPVNHPDASGGLPSKTPLCRALRAACMAAASAAYTLHPAGPPVTATATNATPTTVPFNVQHAESCGQPQANKVVLPEGIPTRAQQPQDRPGQGRPWGLSPATPSGGLEQQQ
jgi:hypothetical protein